MTPSGPKRIDAACTLALFLFTAALAVWAGDQFRRSGLRAQFYQEFFAPAVMLACGHGFHNVKWSDDQALAAFLRLKRDTLACGELGRGLVALPLDYFQRMSLYLEWAVALTWRVAGVSWAAVSWLNALLAGFFAAMVYGVMRLGMRPFVAAIVSAVVVTSPLHLSYLPHLRDYSKAPFLLAEVLLMGIAVKWPLSSRQMLWLSGLGGFVAGVGFGFRTDILLTAVPFLAVLFVFRAGSPSMRARLVNGATASVVLIASFLLTAAPLLSRYAKGGTIGHVALLGFGEGFTAELGLEAKHYALSTPYQDWYQLMVVRSYASRLTGDTRVISMGSAEYDREASRYLMDVIRTFPADVAVRAFSAVAQILNAPFSTTSARATGWVHSPFIARAYARRAAALELAGWLGWAASALVIAGVAARSVRLAAFLVFILLFLGGGAALQFHARHFFYLEFLAWWAVGVIVDCAAAGRRAIPRFVTHGEWRTRETLARIGVGLARSAAVVVATVLVATAVLGATRHDQQQNLNRLFERSLAAPTQPVSFTTMPTGLDRVTMTVDLPELELSPAAWESLSIGTAYLLIDLNPQRCDSWSFSAGFQYEAGLNRNAITTRVTVPLVDPQLGSSMKILIPVYTAWFRTVVDGALSDANPQESTFRGIDLAARDARCIASITKLGDLGAFPILVTAMLGPDWRTASHYQTMAGIETREDGAAFRTRLLPMLPTLEVGRSIISQPMTDSWPGATVFSRVVTAAPPFGLAIDGTPESATTYLFQSRASEMPRGSCALAEGELMAGGLTFGLLRNGLWYQQVSILERGRFIAAGCAQEDGSYAILLANNNPRGVTTARITRIGWVLTGGRPNGE